VLSISWGEPDDFVETQAITAFGEIFMAAAGLGVTVCAASGDHAGSNCTCCNPAPGQFHSADRSAAEYRFGCTRAEACRQQ